MRSICILGVVAMILGGCIGDTAPPSGDTVSRREDLASACRVAIPEVSPPRPILRNSYAHSHFYCANAQGVLIPVLSPNTN